VDAKPDVLAALDRLAVALADSARVEAAFQESARHLAAQASEASRVAFARSEVRARRARLHVRLAAEHLEAVRKQVRDDRRRVPARFRRRREDPMPGLGLVGHHDVEVEPVLQNVLSD
jgi:hypothetical protein